MIEWMLRTRTVSTHDHTLIMGIVNVTPDSFSDGGRFVARDGSTPDFDAAIAHGKRLMAEGSDILDVGGESTRPGADDVGLEEELDRVVPVVAGLAAAGAIVSVDTSKPEVALAAIESGAEIVNDVTAFGSPEMADVVMATGAGVVLMHMQGSPRTMQVDPRYEDVVGEVAGFLGQRAARAVAAGIDRRKICLDPGIGFGKNTEHNLALLAHLDALATIGHPVLVGASRKRVLGDILETAGYPAAPEERDPATAATTALAIAAGAAVVRVHDVRTMLQVARVADAIVRAPRRSRTGGV